MKRFIALTLALVMLCCCAAGCGSDTKEDTVMTVNGTAVRRSASLRISIRAIPEQALTGTASSFSTTP